MMRVNLLRGRPGAGGRMQAAMTPGSSHAFVSRKELLLGSVFLLLGCVILFTQFKKFEAAPFDNAILGALGGDPDGPGAPDMGAAGTPSPVEPEEPVLLQATLDAPTESPGVEPDAPAAAGVEVAASGTSPEAGVASAGGSAAQQSSAAETPASLGPANPAGGELRQMFVSFVDDAVRVFAGTGNVPAYESFHLENPNRVVVDLPGVVVRLPADKLDQTVTHPQVQRVRAAQLSADPPVARLVLDVSSFPKVEFFPQFNGLYIRVEAQ
jgi:hypothetical protein